MSVPLQVAVPVVVSYVSQALVSCAETIENTANVAVTAKPVTTLMAAEIVSPEGRLGKRVCQYANKCRVYQILFRCSDYSVVG
eukprot:m.348839 g.348839  ORF g.348839 m.348839 type:complete len:83 (+) comp20682_c0_seq7:1277-1525(+)